MAKEITYNVQRLIAAVAAEHRLIFKPDDAAFAIVTMNRIVLEESLAAIHTRLPGIWRNSKKPLSGLTAAPSRLSNRRSVAPQGRCGRNFRATSIPRGCGQRKSPRRLRRPTRSR